jgi:hypothetical protein
MGPLLNYVNANLSLFVLITLGLIIVTLVLFIVIAHKMYKSVLKYKELLRGTDGKNLEEILYEKGKMLEHILLEMEIIRDTAKNAEINSKYSIQRVGLVRYNAFEDTGGDLSYALALLNSEADGVVLSSIFSQEETRTYCKPVSRGESKYPLSDEERKAIAQALNVKYE